MQAQLLIVPAMNARDVFFFPPRQHYFHCHCRSAERSIDQPVTNNANMKHTSIGTAEKKTCPQLLILPANPTDQSLELVNRFDEDNRCKAIDTDLYFARGIITQLI